MGSAAAMGAAQSVFGAPGDAVRVGCIGIGGRGGDHLNGLGRLPNVEIAAIADIDEAHLKSGLAQLQRAGRKEPKTYADFRKMLEDKSIDAVSIATPNHWHTLMTIWACQAGKDVYVEKPCSHNVFESQQIVAAARKYGRMVQMGSQIRSSAAVQEAIQKLHAGEEYGDIYLARGLCFKWRDTIGRTPVSEVPAGVDYDLWTGPAPKRPFTKNRFHYNWHWFWDTGNGDIGNQGIHEVDIARWGLGVTYPTKVSAIGGKFMFDDDQETPNVIAANYEFQVNGKKKMMEFEVRHWMTNPEAEMSRSATNCIGNTFYGSKGYLAVDSYTSYKSWMGRNMQPGSAGNKGGDHYLNFIEAVRSRKRETLNAEIQEGAISCVVMNLANISYRVGRTLNFDEKTMTCKNDPEANALLTRAYRAPYVVPKQV
jgi:predicted dehydrogenase